MTTMSTFERIEIALFATCGLFLLFLVVLLVITIWRSPRAVMRPFLDRLDRLIAAVENQIGSLTDGQARLIDGQARLLTENESLRRDVQGLQRDVADLRAAPVVAVPIETCQGQVVAPRRVD